MKAVLITGATGAIGSALAPLFLKEPDTKLRLVIRAKSASHLAERLDLLARFWGTDAMTVAPRVEVMAGDVSRPRLGFDDETFRRLAREVTHVVHAAGNVRLNQALDDARRDALESARSIVALVDACREHGRFRKLEFVSTVGVGGRMPGAVPERPLTEPREYRNTYEAAKAEAETFVLSRMAEGLPATIHRPSMVVGDSQSGRIIHFQVFYHLAEFLTGRRTFGVIPDAREFRLDIVPVDYVARALHIASRHEETAGRILHLASGPLLSPPLTQLARSIRSHLESRGQRLPPLRLVPTTLIRAVLPLMTRLALGRARRALETLPLLLTYLDEPQVFDNTETLQLLSQKDLHVPPVETYLGRVLDYYQAQQASARLSANSGRDGASGPARGGGQPRTLGEPRP